MLMLESRVTFAPQLRGIEQRARSPRLDQAYSGVKEVLVEHSSTNTKSARSQLCRLPEPAKRLSRTRRVRTHRPSFGLNPIHFKSLLRVDSLTDTPATPSTKRHLSLSVRAGLFSISASSNLLARSSILGRGP